MPAHPTVLGWVLDDIHGFADQYVRARAIGLDVVADDMLDIADDGSNDWMKKNDPENPGYVFNGEHSSRSKLRVDTRKWYLSKLAPKKYGDRQALEVSGHLALGEMSEEEIKAELAVLLGTDVVIPDEDVSDLV